MFRLAWLLAKPELASPKTCDSCRPRLEELEDRITPSVTTTGEDRAPPPDYQSQNEATLPTITLDYHIVHDVTALTGNHSQDVSLQLNLSRDLIGIDDIKNDPLNRFSDITGNGFGSEGPIGVAIIDTGIDGSHPYLSVAGGVNTVTAGSFQNDIDGHGTHVAGIIASQHSTYQGVAPGVNLYAVKALHGNSGSWFTVADGLDWVIANAEANNIKVVNMSLGDRGNYPEGSGNFGFSFFFGIHQKINQLESMGVTVVSSAGNDYFRFNPRQGSSDPGVSSTLDVGAVWSANWGNNINWLSGAKDFTTEADQLVSFSQRDPNHSRFILAPGALIMSTVPVGLAGVDPDGNGFELAAGTSMASPHIAGVVALMQDAAWEFSTTSPDHASRYLTTSEIVSLIRSSAVSVVDSDPGNTEDNVINTGATFLRVDAYAAIQAVYDLFITVPNELPTAVVGGPYSGDEGASITFNGSGSDTDGNVVLYEWDFDYDGTTFTADASGSSLTSPSHTYDDDSGAGSFTVALRVKDNSGAFSALSTTSVTVANVAPVADAGGPYSGQENESIAFSGSFTDQGSADTISLWEWDFNYDGTTFDVDATGQNVSHAYSSAATYTIALRVTDDDGGISLVDTASVEVTPFVPNELPTAVVGGPYSGDEGASITFNGSGSDTDGNVVLYEWDFDYDGTTFTADASGSSLTSPSHTYDDDSGAGSFTVALRVKDDSGDFSPLSTTSVTVANVAPVADAGGPYSGQENESIAFSGSFTDQGSADTISLWEWDFNYDGTTFDVDATGQNVSHAYSSAATYTIALRVTDDDGGISLVDTASVEVQVPTSNETFYFSMQYSGSVGGVAFENEDIVAYDGSGYSLFFDGSDVGIRGSLGGGFTIDAFDIISENQILMSFAEAGWIEPPGANLLFVDDSDIVLFTATSLGQNTVGTFEIYFDGSDVGLTRSSEDIDAITLLEDGSLLLSVRGNATASSGFSFADEDIVRFYPSSLGPFTSGTWEMFFDGSSAGLGSGEDIDGMAVKDGKLYLTPVNSLAVPGSSENDEVFVYNLITGAFESGIFFEGPNGNDIWGIDFAGKGSLGVATASASGKANGHSSAAVPKVANPEDTSAPFRFAVSHNLSSQLDIPISATSPGATDHFFGAISNQAAIRLQAPFRSAFVASSPTTYGFEAAASLKTAQATVSALMGNGTTSVTEWSYGNSTEEPWAQWQEYSAVDAVSDSAHSTEEGSEEHHGQSPGQDSLPIDLFFELTNPEAIEREVMPPQSTLPALNGSESSLEDSKAETASLNGLLALAAIMGGAASHFGRSDTRKEERQAF